MDWHLIATAPFDRDLELAVIDRAGVHELIFPCRRVLRGWLKADTNTPVNIFPTHWREWGVSEERRKEKRALTNPFRILRLFNQPKDQEAKHIAEARAVITEATRVLKDSETNDGFAGRKTQKPFDKSEG
jgi:hypothetical protein